jgi:UDP-N-acetylmuramoyl-tripeptide--D-alanyl-D-alanine ligase
MKTEQLYNLFKNSTGITTDSRKVEKGQIFFALWGDNFNGNVYAADALSKGALCAIIDDPQYEAGDDTILVDDCLIELQALATCYREQLKIPVLAITGTNGKTTTKELIAAVLSTKLKVHYTKGNLNNHIGVPLTILSAPDDTQMMIIEMGANHIGEIRTLCQIARPDHGLITNIGTAHIEGFGSFDGVVKTKTELYEYLRKANGIAFYNDRDPLLTEKIFSMINRAVPLTDPDGIELKVDLVSSDLNLVISVDYLHKTYTLRTNLFGRYNLENVRTAIAVGLFMGIGMESILGAIENYIPANNRSQVKLTVTNTVVCDSYNANPSSMSSSLASFASVDAANKVYILGDMLELGDSSEIEHLRILELVKDNQQNVMLVGPVFEKIATGMSFKVFHDSDSLAEYIKAHPISGKTILVKGSRGMHLEKIYDLL